MIEGAQDPSTREKLKRACYDPQAPLYWDRRHLASERTRIFEVCHNCRLCFNLCPSFPALFDAVDARPDEEVKRLTQTEAERVERLCYQCKMCFVKCPYTPPHEYELDFPRLMMRAKAQRIRRDGLPLADRLLGDPVLLGKLGSLVAPLANRLNESPAHRAVFETVMGVHRGKLLPQFHAQTFEAWFRARGSDRATAPEPAAAASSAPSSISAAPVEPATASRVALFATCFVNWNGPDVGRAVVEVLERNGIAVELPEPRCCGMPALDGGDVERGLRMARQVVQSLLPWAEAGVPIVVPNPTCSYMIRQEYPTMLGTPEARKVASAARDIGHFLHARHERGKLDTTFRRGFGRIAYHLPCHLKAQNIGTRSLALLRLLPGTEVELVDRCSAHDGTWAMKKEFFELSLKMGEKLFSGIRETSADLVVSDCPLAAIQIRQGTGRAVYHPVEVLARAYRGDDFDRDAPARAPAVRGE